MWYYNVHWVFMPFFWLRTNLRRNHNLLIIRLYYYDDFNWSRIFSIFRQLPSREHQKIFIIPREGQSMKQSVGDSLITLVLQVFIVSCIKLQSILTSHQICIAGNANTNYNINLVHIPRKWHFYYKLYCNHGGNYDNVAEMFCSEKLHYIASQHADIACHTSVWLNT